MGRACRRALPACAGAAGANTELGGGFALAVQGPDVLQFITQGRADWRVLTGAALTGSGLGLLLGAAYLAGGLADHAADRAHDQVAAAAAAQGYAGAAPLRPILTDARPNAPAAAGRTRDLDCLAEAVYYEARGEDARGQAAVAQVVLNRVKHPAFPKTVCGVVFQGVGQHGCQFSFACDGSMHGRREASAWSRARRIAARALSGVALAEVGSATHFHTTGVDPAWGGQMRRVAQVGMHVFYRFAPRPAGGEISPVQRAVLTAGPAPAGDFSVLPAMAEKASAPGPSPAADSAATEPSPAPAPTPASKAAETAGLRSLQPAAEAAS